MEKSSHRVPIEIWRCIFDNLDPWNLAWNDLSVEGYNRALPSYKAAALTCRRFYGAVRPYLFRVLDVIPTCQCSSLTNSDRHFEHRLHHLSRRIDFFASRSVSSHVKVIIFGRGRQDGKNNCGEAAGELFSKASSFPRLQRLYIFDVRFTWSHLYFLATAPRLRFLQLTNCQFKPTKPGVIRPKIRIEVEALKLDFGPNRKPDLDPDNEDGPIADYSEQLIDTFMNGKLEGLHLDFRWNYVTFLELLLLRPDILSGIKRLKVDHDGGSGDPEDEVLTLISECPSLRHLWITTPPDDPEVLPLERVLPGERLSNLTSFSGYYSHLKVLQEVTSLRDLELMDSDYCYGPNGDVNTLLREVPGLLAGLESLTLFLPCITRDIINTLGELCPRLQWLYFVVFPESPNADMQHFLNEGRAKVCFVMFRLPVLFDIDVHHRNHSKHLTKARFPNPFECSTFAPRSWKAIRLHPAC